MITLDDYGLPPVGVWVAPHIRTEHEAHNRRHRMWVMSWRLSSEDTIERKRSDPVYISEVSMMACRDQGEVGAMIGTAQRELFESFSKSLGDTVSWKMP